MPPDSTPATPEPASPAAVPTAPIEKHAKHVKNLMAIFTGPRTGSRNMSWADETEEELKGVKQKEIEAWADQEAREQAKIEAERKEAAEGWAKVKKTKKRSQCKKKFEDTEAGSLRIEPTEPAALTEAAQEEEKVELPTPGIEIEAVAKSLEQVDAAEGPVSAQEEDSIVPAMPKTTQPGLEQPGIRSVSTVAIDTAIAPQIAPEVAAEASQESQPEPVVGETAKVGVAPATATASVPAKLDLEAIAEPMAQLTIGLVIDQKAVIYSSPAAPVVKQTVNPEVTGLPSGSTTEPAVELSVDDVKEAAATDAASTTPKNTKSSRRCKQKEAAKKAATAAAAAVPSSLSSGTVGEASDAVGDASETFQGLASPVKEVGLAPSTPLTCAAIVAEDAPAASLEPAAEVSKPAAVHAADAWNA